MNSTFIISLSCRNMLAVGAHTLTRKRRKGSPLLVIIVAAAAVLFTAGGDIQPFSVRDDSDSVIGDMDPCCVELVATSPIAFSPDMSMNAAARSSAARFAAASRWRVAARSRFLPAGVAPERGLQVRTILAARSISARFPEIHEIGGVRADPLRWHPNGLALDVMIPNPGTAHGIALGDAVVAFVLKNAARFGMQDAIWRGTYYTPTSARQSGAGHYDHVHVTTTGGGYPTGREVYLR